MSKNVARARSSGVAGVLPPGCGFEVQQFFDGNTNTPAGWMVRRTGSAELWREVPWFREWDEVLKYIGGNT